MTSRHPLQRAHWWSARVGGGQSDAIEGVAPPISDEPGHHDSGPWQCPYCGTRFYAPLILCPECGANQVTAAARVAANDEAAANDAALDDTAPDEQPRGVAHRLRGHWGALPRKLGAGQLYGGDYPPIDEEQAARRLQPSFYAWSSVAILAVALTGYAIVHRAEWEPKLGAQVVVGSVIGSKDKLGALAGGLPASHGAQSNGALPHHDHGSMAPAVTARANAGRQGFAQQKPPAAGRLPATPDYASMRSDLARSLASARTNLEKNSLWPARRAIMAALAEQPGNAEAQQMRGELVAREQRRDALLGHARLCAHEREWACVRQDAGQAASVDTSSREARRLLTLASTEHHTDTGVHNDWTWPWSDQAYAQAADPRPHQEALFWHH